MNFLQIITWFLLLGIYFLPTYIAYRKQKKNAMAIMVTNVLVGWTGIGWLAVLIWALIEDR